MAAPPRPPRPPRPSPGRARLAPPRPPGSVELDRRRLPAGGQVGELAPFVRWDRFLDRVRFRQGEHITIVGTTGSGKTVLERELVEFRLFTALLGTKPEDRELYKPFQDRGYEITAHFDPSPAADESRIIFRPRLSTPDRKGLRKQAEAFEAMLFEVWDYGGWTIVCDEAVYLTQTLGLGATLELFWTGGRSHNITVVAATQKPVSIPRVAFDGATHLFFFRNTDQDRIRRMAEMAGSDSAVLRALIPVLPRHEFVYVDTRTGTLLRSMVLL